MNRKLKHALTAEFYAPPPAGKAAFLKHHRRRELGRWELLMIQVRYIRWWVWALSLAVFSRILLLAVRMDKRLLWSAAALTPFLALLVTAENRKSRLYYMEELELACRVSRQSVILARMLVLGIFHLVLLGTLIPLLAAWGDISILQAGVYLLTPYLLTAAMGMELSRRIKGREGMLSCGAAALFVSALQGAAIEIKPVLYQKEYVFLWLWLLVIAAAAMAVEFKINKKEMEELQWS